MNPDTLKNLLTNLFANMALQGSALGSAGRIGMSGMAATGALGPGLAGVSPWVQIGIEAAKLPGQLHDMGVALIENQRHLQQYNGVIASSMAQLEVQRIGRDIKTASENANSVQFLTQATSRLEDSLRPIESAMSRFGNTVVGGLEGIASDVIDALTPADIKEEIESRAFTDRSKSPTFNAMIEQDAQFWIKMQNRKQQNPPLKDIWGEGA